MALAIRSKSGKLKASTRKRRLRGMAQGEVLLLDRRRVSKSLGGGRRIRSKNAMSVDFAVSEDFGIVSDVRPLVALISMRLMEHYRASLLAGQRADGKGALPPLRASTLSGEFGSRKGDFGHKTGWMADHWARLAIRGSSVKASTKIKPNGADGRSFQINLWAARAKDPVDFQSVDGTAAIVIADAIQEWRELAITDARGMVGIPASVNTSPVLLSEIRGL